MDNVEKQEISYTEYLNNKKQIYYTYKTGFVNMIFQMRR